MHVWYISYEVLQRDITAVGGGGRSLASERECWTLYTVLSKETNTSAALDTDIPIAWSDMMSFPLQVRCHDKAVETIWIEQDWNSQRLYAAVISAVYRMEQTH